MQHAPSTELEAVNAMLGTIGETPVNSLDTVSSVDTAIARDTLHAISREVQARGWWFNEDYGHTFVLDTHGIARVPPNLLSVKPSRGGPIVVQRGDRLFNRRTNADTFETPPRADVVWFLPFDSLPETARRYITIRACRIFQTQVLGSETQNVFTEAHEEEAYSAFALEHNDFIYAEGHNYMTDSTSVTDIWDK